MSTYEYKFIKIEAKTTAFKGIVPREDYHQVIDQHARVGWRLVQIFAPAVKGYGWVDFYELIFEREINLPARDHLFS